MDLSVGLRTFVLETFQGDGNWVVYPQQFKSRIAAEKVAANFMMVGTKCRLTKMEIIEIRERKAAK